MHMVLIRRGQSGRTLRRTGEVGAERNRSDSRRGQLPDPSTRAWPA